MTAPLRRWLTPVVAVLAAWHVAGRRPPRRTPPRRPPHPPGTRRTASRQLLTDVIEPANRDTPQAKAKLDKSKKRQTSCTEVSRAQGRRWTRSPRRSSEIAAQSYRTGRIGAVAMLLESDAPDSFVQRAASSTS